MKATRTLVALLFVALLGFGCGGSSDGPAGPEASDRSISKAAFIKKADSICLGTQRRVAAGFKAVGHRHAEHFQVAKVAMMAQVAIPALQAQVTQIRALGSPNGDERQIEAILEATRQAIAKGPTQLAHSYDFYRRTAKLARAYGLRACAVG